MQDIEAWPLVSRADIVLAFRRESDGTSEAPFRTLRRRAQVSTGRRVVMHEAGRLRGRFTYFCSLNVDAAVLARRGYDAAAREAAAAAADVEHGPAFAALVRCVELLDSDLVAQVQEGAWPAWHRVPFAHSPDRESTETRASRRIDELLREVAIEVAQVRRGLPQLAKIERVVAGTVDEIDDDEAVVSPTTGGRRYRVPRSLVDQAGRDALGALVVVITERISNGLYSVVVPAIRTTAAQEFDPFARSPHGFRLGDDPALLKPASDSPRVLVPMPSS